MVIACGEEFIAVPMDQGDLWSFSKGTSCQLRLGTDVDQLLPALVGVDDEVFGGEAVVMVAAGDKSYSLRDGKGDVVDLGSKKIQPAGAR